MTVLRPVNFPFVSRAVDGGTESVFFGASVKNGDDLVDVGEEFFCCGYDDCLVVLAGVEAADLGGCLIAAACGINIGGDVGGLQVFETVHFGSHLLLGVVLNQTDRAGPFRCECGHKQGRGSKERKELLFHTKLLFAYFGGCSLSKSRKVKTRLKCRNVAASKVFRR